MTRKDYIAIARAFTEVRSLVSDGLMIYNLERENPTIHSMGVAEWAIRELQTRIEDILLEDNPRFSRQRFNDACNLD